MPIVTLRVSEEELATWRKLAGERGLSKWLRDSANATAAVEHPAGLKLDPWRLGPEGFVQ